VAAGTGDEAGKFGWLRPLGTGFVTVATTLFRNLSGVRGLTGVLFIGFFIATVFAAWRYPDSSFGKFSQTLGVAISSVLVGLWGADYYYRKDAYKKRYRDVEVSVYTTKLLIAGVEAIRQHIISAKTSISSMKPSTDDEHQNKLIAHSQIEAGHTAAILTISMSYLALANLETFSKDAVESGKKKFASNEEEASVLQQVREGGRSNTPTAVPPESESATNNENGGSGNE
jgi:hypothetical protein